LKKIFITILLGCTLLLAESSLVEKKIYSHILHALYPEKAGIKVWSDDKNKEAILQKIPKVQLIKSPKDADFVLIQKDKDIHTNGVIFVTNYHMLQHYKKDAIGGFYWQKGRPNILFLKPNLQKYKIRLPKDMQEYIEDTL